MATMPHSEQPSPDKNDSAQAASPSSHLGLDRSVSPRSTPKSVSISRRTETISPLILAQQKSIDDFHICSIGTKLPHVKAPKNRRLSGRPPLASSPSLKSSPAPLDGTAPDDNDQSSAQNEAHGHHESLDNLIDQISAWIFDKRDKRHRRKANRAARKVAEAERDANRSSERRNSDASDESVDLDKLERILRQNLNVRKPSMRRGSILRSKTSMRKLLRKQSSASDSEYLDGDIVVPTCDVCLDNSKTLAYSGGGGASDLSSDEESSDPKQCASVRDFDAWAKFKFEIVRLVHTLRVKGWRKVPMEMSAGIEVQRLSGALTNAVYVVSPPCDLELASKDEAGNVVKNRKPPPKLLLRIYGPQVEHLIDREAELAILRRLARKRIGPRLLGCFANGRFEEFFHAKPLTPEELRCPDTSRQIAKRMRELHDGVELLETERDDGPFVFRNWDKWLDRVEQIVTWMDEQLTQLGPGSKPTGSKTWLRRGYICGVPWPEFRAVVEKYRDWLKCQYGGAKQIRDKLVFAHNDTQYGNILRMVPTGESPLLLPANTHKQLVVIDFEYASANTRGLEFANHFTEWGYNYHDEKKPYAFLPQMYPNPEEQDRFIRSYVRHRPQFNVSTPKMAPADPETPGDMSRRPTTSISDFMLDARNPQQPLAASATLSEEEVARKAAEDGAVKRLMEETRWWRLANSAQWIAWGLVQAKVPGMPAFDATSPGPQSEGETAEELLGERAEVYKEMVQGQQGENVEEDEEFDYLGYAQHRAMFFWGDAIQLGLVKPEDLPEETREKIKTVPY
ncbi:hypothetical protein AC579_2106 [Pseudocercospora musae]|uniref:Choline kinase N-terminal domain-containing protein n=1 Tax=Pseudocercospora musae TaxID=113226 RepID=A0A139ICU7_9PEZI|nr:hypothetical protein AC579_2106 [Pseudocercospora musae]